jgi:thioredoxin reductase (NADPH)
LLNLSSLRAGGEAGSDEDIYDVVIIGGGPAGATAALYAARANLKVVVLDKSAVAGALGVTSKIANYPGVPTVVTGLELLQTMRDQAAGFGAIFVEAQVVSSDLQGNPKEVQTSAGVYRGKTVMVATGKMGRKNKVPGEDAFLGRGVSYCATCDAAFFRDQTVAVIGSSEEAVEEALFLTRFAGKLYLVAPGDRFHAEPERLERLEENPKVELRRNRALRAILGANAVTGVHLSGRGGDETLPVDGVFIYLPGNVPIIDFLEGVLETTEEGCVKTDRERMTNIPGVYAIGDVTCNFIQQAVVAASDGAIAAMSAEKYIRGRAKAKSDWA